MKRIAKNNKINNNRMLVRQEEKVSDWIEEPIYTVNGQRMLKRYKKLKLVGEGSYSKCWLVKT